MQFGEIPVPRDVALAAVSSVAASVRAFARAAAAHPDAPVAFAAGVVPNVRAVRLVLVVPVAVVIVVLVGRRVPDVVAHVPAGQPDVPAPALPSGVGDELRMLRELQRNTEGAFVFETERGGPFYLLIKRELWVKGLIATAVGDAV